MLVTDWMRAAAIFLYVAAMIFVLSQCNRLLEPARPKAGISIPKEEASKADIKSPILERAEERAKKRKEYEKELARQRAAHHRLEAHLTTMVQTDIPAALGELASSAVKFRNKLSDLKHLKKPDQWERETPVKEALARNRDLTSEWYGLDREAQKGRDGPTLHSSSDIEALTKRIDLFKRGGEEIAEFAGALPVFYPKVPETLMLSALDAIARVALPKDAFDPCRDPSACPKPAPSPVAAAFPPPPPIPTNVKPPSGPTYCVDHHALAPHRTVALHEEPTPDSYVLSRVLAGSCDLTRTGRRGFHETAFARELWLEVVDRHGNRGWVIARYLRPRQ